MYRNFENNVFQYATFLYFGETPDIWDFTAKLNG